MRKNTATQTKRIIKDITPPSKLVRTKLLDLKVGESIYFDKGKWPFKSPPASYLYTMRRQGREYTYTSIPFGKYLIVRSK